MSEKLIFESISQLVKYRLNGIVGRAYRHLFVSVLDELGMCLNIDFSYKKQLKCRNVTYYMFGPTIVIT